MDKANIEHVNVTVRDGAASAAWLCEVFGWKIRWSGQSKAGGYSYHVGGEHSYIAIYQPPGRAIEAEIPWGTVMRLNHVGIVVDDLDAVEDRVAAAGFTPFSHGDYEPGRRFYFLDHDQIEWEVVCYA